MEDKQPTEAQIKEFWEWCGFKWIAERHYVHGYLMYGGKYYDGWWQSPVKEEGLGRYEELPFIDLNDLFKYAVSRFWVCEISLVEGIFWSVTVSLPCPPDGTSRTGKALVETDLALALFWAIWEVIHGS